MLPKAKHATQHPRACVTHAAQRCRSSAQLRRCSAGHHHRRRGPRLLAALHHLLRAQPVPGSGPAGAVGAVGPGAALPGRAGRATQVRGAQRVQRGPLVSLQPRLWSRRLHCCSRTAISCDSVGSPTRLASTPSFTCTGACPYTRTGLRKCKEGAHMRAHTHAHTHTRAHTHSPYTHIQAG